MDNNILNVQFVKDYIEFLKEDNSKITGLLNYAFYLLTRKKDELSLNFAYSIIINYTFRFHDFSPLIEFSIIFGYSPILDIIFNKMEISTSKEMENFIANYYIEDNKYKGKILTSGQKIIYRLIESDNDYSMIAPTSFGKTELMLESAIKSKGDCIIIVPLIALLSQIKYDISELIKKYNVNAKIITHHEINKSENYKNIYILTQERCFELIKRNKVENITDLFIDESHKLLNNDIRSYKLSQIIFLIKRKFNCNVRYYSPVLYNPASISIKGLNYNQLEVVNGIRDMKCYDYYFYHSNNKEIYIPNTERMTNSYILENRSYRDFDEYILKNGKCKNIVFLNSPKTVENHAIEFSKKINEEINFDSSDLIEFIGEDYYIIETIKKGVIYIHGEMPDLIKYYLLDIYRKNKDIKYLFTNSSILEGVNTPSDTLFIYEYNIGGGIMKPQDFINLRGRINRINEIVKNNDLSRLICETHFNCSSDYVKKRIRNEIIDPCYGIIHDDEVKNEYLERCTTDDNSDEFISSLKQIKLIDNDVNIKEIFDEEITNDNNIVINQCLLNDISLNDNQKIELEERLLKYHNARINSIDKLLSAMNEIFQLGYSDDIEISRLHNNEARNFYSILLKWLVDGKNIKEKSSRMTNYYMKKAPNELIYIGKRGEICAELIGSRLVICPNCQSNYRVDKNNVPIRLRKVWMINNHDKRKLYNMCVIKIKVEEDFISFKLMPYIESLKEIDNTIIDETLYNLIKYKSDDKFEIELIKEGISIYLARELNNPLYVKYISFSELGVIISKEILHVFEGNNILSDELNKYVN